MWLSIQVCILGLLSHYCTSAMMDDGSYLNKMTIQGGIATVAKHIAPDNRFLLASCKKRSFIDCDIIRGKLSHRLSPLLNETCAFKPPLPPNTTPMMPLELELFGANRSIASWFENRGGQFLRKNVAIIDMSTCTTKYLSFDQPHFNGMSSDTAVTNLVVYEKTFDVITSDETACRSFPKCRLKYDEAGRLLGKAMPFPTSLHQFRAIELVEGTPAYGFLAIGEPRAKRSPALIEYVTSQMGFVRKINTDVVVNGSASHATMSNANGKFTLCAVEVKYFEVIRCNQFEMGFYTVDKEPKMKAAVTYFDKIRAMSVHSLPRGGFLVLTVGCPEHMEGPLHSWFGKFTVYGVDRSGSAGKFFEKELTFECRNNLILGTNELDDRYCFYFSCDTITYVSKAMRPVNYLKMYQKCFSRTEVEAYNSSAALFMPG